MPQQYSNRRSSERGFPAERAPFGLDEGQRRSGGGDARGILPAVKEAKGDHAGLEFGWHHEAHSRSRPKPGDGSVVFFP